MEATNSPWHEAGQSHVREDSPATRPRLHSEPLTPPDSDTISVVIATYQRPDACERALRSALNQTEPPLEVLVCDDCSADDTEARFREWEGRDKRVRYLRVPRNSGGPATARNLGIKHAQGNWIALLDDDDEWLPGKLAAQRAAFATESADVIGTNALRSDGSIYFPDAPPAWRPTRLDMLRANPLIVSSVLVRRNCLIPVAALATAAWAKGVEDYAMWLELARQGARFLILGEPLIRYEDASTERMSLERIGMQRAVARVVWRHALREPARSSAIAALRQSAGVAQLIGAETLARLRTRRSIEGSNRRSA
jgi:teichuronic acid biosynthesis glycosyltransferase TuaG